MIRTLYSTSRSSNGFDVREKTGWGGQTQTDRRLDRWVCGIQSPKELES